MSDKAKQELTPEEQALKKRNETKARIAQILGQGRANHRMQEILTLLGPDRRGCFVRERHEDISAYQQLGYEVETGLDVPGLHGTGDGRVRVGDVILMTTSMDNFEVIQEVEVELIKKKLGKEKEEYMNQSKQNIPAGIVPFSGVQNIN